MAKASSNDLGARFLAAYERGGIGLAKLAATFQVSRGWAEKIWRIRRETGGG